MKIPKVSIIIPTYQRDEILCNTIQYALNQDFEDYEILIIDQTENHSQETYQFFKTLPPKVKIIHFLPASLPGARNHGISVAKGEIIIMIDDDVILESNFIQHHLDSYYGDKIDCVAGKIREAKKYRVKACPINFNSDFIKWLSPSSFYSQYKKEAFRVPGGNFSIRKKVIFDVGPFDENFLYTAWGEEYDFSLRLKNKGYRIVYNPKAEIFHLNYNKGGCNRRDRFNYNTIYSHSHNMSYLVEKNNLNRVFYIYLIWYVYKRVFFKKDYISLKGLVFITKGAFFFAKGLWDGFLKGSKHSGVLAKLS